MTSRNRPKKASGNLLAYDTNPGAGACQNDPNNTG
jgi:hypothetical protein